MVVIQFFGNFDFVVERAKVRELLIVVKYFATLTFISIKKPWSLEQIDRKFLIDVDACWARGLAGQLVAYWLKDVSSKFFYHISEKVSFFPLSCW